MQPGRPLPQLPIERPLPELPYSSYDTLPPARPVAKTPPPSRRIAVEHDIDTPPPLPPVSGIAMVKKSQSAFFNMDKKVQRPSLPDASIRPPLPPRKSSVPVSSHHNATTPPSKRDSSSSLLSADRSSLYDIPKSMKPGPGVGRGPSSVSLDSVSVCSFGRAPSPINYVPVSESMTLKQLVAYHQNEFPLRVEVSAGYFGDTECDTFSEGDHLNFHFIKQVSVAVIETATGHLVRVPLNSAARFSLVYDPNNNPKEAVTGFEFKSVKDVLAQKDMPKIICATKAHGNPSNVSHSVQAGELLLINEVKHGRFGGQSLICTSIESEKQKRLPENCQGFFSTAPNNVMLYLPELTKKFELPLKVIVSELPSSGNLGGRISDSLTVKEIVTIVSVNKDSTIIATPVPDEEDLQFSSDDASMMFDIPVDLEILEVQIIEEKNSEEFEKLYVDTRQLLDSFDPLKTDKQVRVGKQDDLYYTAIREDHKNVGIELLASESIYSEPRQVLARKKMENGGMEKLKSSVEQSSTSSSPLPQIIEPKCLPSEQTSESSDYYAMDLGSSTKHSPSRSPARSPAHSPLPPYSGTPMQDVPLYTMSKLMMMNGQSPDVEELRRDVMEMKGSMMLLKQQMEGLRQTINSLQLAMIAQPQTKNGNYVDMLPSKDSIVYKMSSKEVLQMLDKLNLSQYKEMFEREEVDGTLLSELDEDTLKSELGMTSKIHRKKLLLVIQGKQTYQHLVMDT